MTKRSKKGKRRPPNFARRPNSAGIRRILYGNSSRSARYNWILGSSPDVVIDTAFPDTVLFGAALELGARTDEGSVVEAVALPWFEILGRIKNDPNFMYTVDWRVWEEILAGAYKQAGYDVILTSRSNDQGRDVIAVKKDIVTVRIFDQMKRLGPGRKVTLEEVHSMLGTITAASNVSKGVITTTADFAPGVYSSDELKRLIPNRLELRPKEKLIEMLVKVAGIS